MDGLCLWGVGPKGIKTIFFKRGTNLKKSISYYVVDGKVAKTLISQRWTATQRSSSTSLLWCVVIDKGKFLMEKWEAQLEHACQNKKCTQKIHNKETVLFAMPWLMVWTMNSQVWITEAFIRNDVSNSFCRSFPHHIACHC